MSNIYAIRDDGLQFKELDLEIRDFRRHAPESISIDEVFEFSIRNMSLSSWWWTPETEFISLSNPDAIIPDLAPLFDSLMALSPKAYRLLGDTLKPYGEFLPVIADGETYQLFNCLTVGEANEDKCKYDYVDDKGVKSGITYLEFQPGAAEHLVFKTPSESCITLFCNDKFKDIVESFELTGLSFDSNLIQKFE